MAAWAAGRLSPSAGEESWELSLEGLERLARRSTAPAAEARQAEERLITQHTIEERIIELHHSKRELADSLLEDSGSAAKLTADELRSLLEG